MKRVIGGILFMFFFASISNASNVETLGIGAKATAMGGAYSAYADDPYAVYYNPAGLVQIKAPVVSAGVLAVTAEGSYDDLTVRSNGTVILGPASYSKRYDLMYVPSAGVAYPVTDRMVLGLGAYIPFGFEIDKSDDPVRNPSAHDSFHSGYIRRVVTPSIAYKVSDTLSLGIGISLGNSNMIQESLIWGTANRIKIDISDDFNWSFNAGVMYHPVKEIDLGLTYRGRAKSDFDGDVDINGIDTGIEAKCNFDAPTQVQTGIRYKPSQIFTIEGDLVWTQWSIAKDQVTEFSAPLMGVLSEIRVARDWSDTIAIKVGAEWHVNDMWDVRAGYFYDPCPIPDDTFDFSWYETDRRIFSLGTGVHKGNWDFDAVVQYVNYGQFVDRIIGGESVNLNNAFSDNDPTTDERVSAHGTGSIWTAGITVSYKIF